MQTTFRSLLVAALVAVLALAGCGKDDKKDRDTEDVSTTVTNATTTPPDSTPNPAAVVKIATT